MDDFPSSSDDALRESYYEPDVVDSHNAVDALSLMMTEFDMKDDASSTVTGTRSSVKANHEYGCILF
jgi:hypothetical protein